MKKKQLPAWTMLTIITLVAGVLLGLTFGVTKEKIDEQLLQQAESVRQALVPQAQSFQPFSEENASIYEGVDESGEAVGYVAVNTVMGFGGEVEITVGVDADGVLNGISVGGANFSETAGLGAKSKEPAFQKQFAGKAYPLDLAKNGGEIDAITAATITSSAVVHGVNDSLKKMADAGCFTIADPVVLVDELSDNRNTTTEQGY